jgi:hypothetical protein
MKALIEEAQILANRMEGGLEDQNDLRTMAEEVTKLKKLRGELYEECKNLLEKTDETKDEDVEKQIGCD